MNRIIILLLIIPVFGFSQKWIIIDVLEQSRKELVCKIDNGDEVKRKTIKNPSIVKLIQEYQEKGV